MSTIGSDPRLNIASLERLDRQVALDDLQRQQGGAAGALGAADGLAPAADGFAPAVERDAGEAVLNAAAWDGDGERLLSGDLVLEAHLAGMDLGEAADHAADAVIDAFA